MAGRVNLRASSADPGAKHMLLLGDWGADGSLLEQRKVAQAMAAYCASQRFTPEALFFLGDNFYGSLNGGASSPRWQSQFEQMYPAASFPGPCYAVLGNHDYHVLPAGKPDSEIAYTRRTGTRWRLPSKWYRFEFPEADPLVTFLALDSNIQGSTRDKLSLTPAERLAQFAWLKAELAKPRVAPFLAFAAHHPIYSNGEHGDSPSLARQWDSMLRSSRAHLYLCGHDHDLQHLEFANHPTSFVISGGGGAPLRDLLMTSRADSRFAEVVHGFTHLEATREQLTIRHINADGQVVHEFRKSPDGAVRIG